MKVNANIGNSAVTSSIEEVGAHAFFAITAPQLAAFCSSLQGQHCWDMLTCLHGCVS